MSLSRIRELERKLSNIEHLVRSIARSLGIDCNDVVECLREIAKRVERLMATRPQEVQTEVTREEELSYLRLPSRPEILERYYRKYQRLDEDELKVLKAILMGYTLPGSIRRVTRLPEHEVNNILRRLASSDYRLVSFVRCSIKIPGVGEYATSINFPSVYLWALCSYYPILKIDDRQVTIPQYQAHILKERLENALNDRNLVEEVCKKLSGAGAIIKCREYTEENRCSIKLLNEYGQLDHYYPDIIAMVGDREWIIECYAFSYDIQGFVKKFVAYTLNRINLWIVVNDSELAVEQILQRVGIAVFEGLRNREFRYNFRISKIGEFLNYREVSITF